MKLLLSKIKAWLLKPAPNYDMNRKNADAAYDAYLARMMDTRKCRCTCCKCGRRR